MIKEIFGKQHQRIQGYPVIQREVGITGIFQVKEHQLRL
jgi:hypothetical protein